jgi:predicted HTH transcriptional regulator
MARVKNNLLIQGTSGAVGKSIVYRTGKRNTHTTKFPDMSGIIPSKNQTKRRALFAEAVAFAKSVINNPEINARYKAESSYSVYHAAIKEYLSRFNPQKAVGLFLPVPVKAALQALSLSEPQLRAVVFINGHKKLTNSLYQKINGVSKATATRHLLQLAGLDIIKTNGAKGAGAGYTIGSWWADNGLMD